MNPGIEHHLEPSLGGKRTQCFLERHPTRLHLNLAVRVCLDAHAWIRLRLRPRLRRGAPEQNDEHRQDRQVRTRTFDPGPIRGWH